MHICTVQRFDLNFDIDILHGVSYLLISESYDRGSWLVSLATKTLKSMATLNVLLSMGELSFIWPFIYHCLHCSFEIFSMDIFLDVLEAYVWAACLLLQFI